jgi:uncharacterized protein YjbI with pentapeptide repeats
VSLRHSFILSVLVILICGLSGIRLLGGWAGALAGSLVGGAIVVVWFGPKWQLAGDAVGVPADRRTEMENELRRTLAQLVGGSAVLLGLYFTWQQLVATRDTLQLAQAGQISERFAKSVEHLANPDMHIRLGGLYGLQRVGLESNQDRQVVLDVLASYVRSSTDRADQTVTGCVVDSTPAPASATQPAGTGQRRCADFRSTACEDVRAALAILSTRHRWASTEETSPTAINLERITVHGWVMDDGFMNRGVLNHACLTDITLGNARFNAAELAHARVANAQLEGAQLRTANLQYMQATRVRLVSAQLQDADLRNAVLSRVNLDAANLTGAKLSGATLASVSLSGAILTRADLTGVDLRNVSGLTAAQIKSARTDATTILPANLTPPNGGRP